MAVLDGQAQRRQVAEAVVEAGALVEALRDGRETALCDCALELALQFDGSLFRGKLLVKAEEIERESY
jgi:hypothetical protein